MTAGARGAPAFDPILARVRALCLAFPRACEVVAWDAPTFRTAPAPGGRMFALYAVDVAVAGAGAEGRTVRPAVWLAAAAENQALLVASDPARYFVPPYVGPKGWVGVWLDRRPSWRTVAALVADAHARAGSRSGTRCGARSGARSQVRTGARSAARGRA